MTIILDIRRHAKPKKDPETGASLDELTEEGIEQAKEIGKKLIIPNIIVAYSSPKKRAYQTIKNILLGTRLYNEGNVDEAITIDERLAVLDIGPDYKKEAFLNQDGSKRSYDEVVQHIINHPNDEVKKAAGSIAKYIVDRMEDKMGNDVLIEGITHGPKPELFLLEIFGAKNVDDIGGGFKPGENFKIEIKYGNNSKIYKATLEFKEEKKSLDIDKVKYMANEYARK